VAGEQLVAAYSAEHRLDGVSLRLSWIYGPERTSDCFLRDMVKAAIAERPFSRPWGNGFPRQYIHADDAAAALVCALATPSLPRTEYAITGDRLDTLDDIAELVRSVLPKSDVVLGHGADPFDDLQGRIDISAAKRDLGFVPLTDLSDGIRNLAERLSRAPFERA
jgi:UDP-glucuronate 4-epimerase